MTTDDSLFYDFSGAEEYSGDTVLPRGTYQALISDCEIRYGKTSGHPYYNLTYKILDPDFEGVRVYGTVSFSPGAKSMAFTQLRAILGADGVPAGPFDIAANIDNIKGSYVRIRVEPREDPSGTQRNEVRKVLPFGGETPTALPAATDAPAKAKRGGSGKLW